MKKSKMLDLIAFEIKEYHPGPVNDDAKRIVALLERLGFLPPPRTEHGITKNDWEPEDE